jgi:alcohol dehydrogenase
VQAIRTDGTRVYLDSRAPAPVADVGEAVVQMRWAITAPAPGPAGRSPETAPPGGALTLGHQFVGTVASLHDGADRDLRKRWEGKRVVGSVDVVCTQCDLCRAGLSMHCRARRVLGLRAWDGCMAEAFKLPLRNLVEVPQSVDDQAAAFSFMLSGALHAAQLVRIEGKPYVTVLGDSAEALLCAQVMARLNASVRLLGKRQFALCEKWGIKHRHQSEVGRRHDQDIVVDCTGGDDGGWGLALAVQLARPRGKIVLRHGRAASADLAAIVDLELQVIGARYGSIADAVSLLARGGIDTASLITRRFPLAEGVAAIQAVAAADQIAVLVEGAGGKSAQHAPRRSEGRGLAPA